MLKKSLVVAMFALVAACFAGTAAADIVCADSSYCVVIFGTTKNRVTIAPNGAGETFAGTSITLEVYLRNCAGAALAGITPDMAEKLYRVMLEVAAEGGSFQ